MIRKPHTQLLILTGVAIASVAIAADALTNTPFKFVNGFVLTPGQTYFSFMKKTLIPAMEAVAPPAADKPPFPNPDQDIKVGKGVAVQLANGIFNFHVDFPKNMEGGRSYGVLTSPSLQVGDWPDITYLNNLAKTVANTTDAGALANFYKTIVQVLGNSDGSNFDNMANSTQNQLVAANFIAIYSAEQYRGNGDFKGTQGWDDAILQATMVGAVHGGQSKFTKFYNGQFSDVAVDQDAVKTNGGKAGDGCAYFAATRGKGLPDGYDTRPANMGDYWQPGKTAVIGTKRGKLGCTGRSGIHIAKADYEAMGHLITTFEANNPNLAKVQAIVGKSDNVIKAVSLYYTDNKASNSTANALADAVSAFLVDVRHDADTITQAGLKGTR